MEPRELKGSRAEAEREARGREEDGGPTALISYHGDAHRDNRGRPGSTKPQEKIFQEHEPTSAPFQNRYHGGPYRSIDLPGTLYFLLDARKSSAERERWG